MHSLQSTPSKNIILVGCGFLGKAAAQLFCNHGYSVLALVRSKSSQEALSLWPSFPKNHIKTACCDVTDLSSVEALQSHIPAEATLIYAVSSGKGNSDTYEAVYRDGLERVLKMWQPKKVIFVSSTSVYAQTTGEIVTETSLAEPDRKTGQILLEAEAIALAAGGLVARFSGIYGPGRSILLKKFLEGSALIEEQGDRWINQIHRDDGAHALLSLVTSQAPSGIYNVTDATPATQCTVYQWIANYLQRPLPPSGPADKNRKRGWTSKRVSHEKLQALGWTPHFGSYKEALPSLVEAYSL